MNQTTLEIPGLPASKGSYNVYHGHFVPADKKLRRYTAEIGLLARRAAPEIPLQGPISLEIAYYLPQPVHLQGINSSSPHITRPDIDKLSRATMDGLSKIIYNDDCQVYNLNATKLYTENYPKTIIKINHDQRGR